MTLQNTAYFAIDWGTTNFRAFALDKNDTLLDTKSLPLGLLQVESGKFAETLQPILENWVTSYATLPIYMGGMVGSARGWHNVDYVAAPATASALASKTYCFTLPWGAQGYILPGVSYHYDSDKFDVMRGEEIQILGLSELKSLLSFQAILPGTHSKHVLFNKGKVESFSSFLTGEFFSMITQHSLLSKGLVDTVDHKTVTEVFKKGVLDAQEGELTNFIFLGWTRRLFKQIADTEVKDYISGLLIGYELRNVNAELLYIVGGSDLSDKYKLACETLSINAQKVDGNLCFLAGMQIIRKELL